MDWITGCGCQHPGRVGLLLRHGGRALEKRGVTRGHGRMGGGFGGNGGSGGSQVGGGGLG